MTRELRNFAKNRIEYLIKISPFVFDEPDREALEMAIQALSQEPCDNAMSREDVFNTIYNMELSNWVKDELWNELKKLPLVTPKPETVTEFADRCRECGKMRKGHWITDDTWSDIAYNTEFLEFLYNHINPNDMEHYRQMFEMKDAVAVNGAEKESSDADSN